MAFEEHLRIIKQGVEAWNQWRKDDSTIPNLCWSDLRGADLHGADLHDVDLKNSKLIGADLHGADLRGSILSDAYLSRADLRWAKMNGAYLTEADLTEANLSWAYLSGAALDEANLHGAELNGAYLYGAELRWANLSGAYLNRASLDGAYLIEADLHSASLIGAKMFGAKLHHANLCGANLQWADLSEANLCGAELNGANLFEAKLYDANLHWANLCEANLHKANLTCIQLVETKIEGAKFTDSRVYGISAWRLEGLPKDQSNLIITRYGEPVITVDNLEVAQFIYLLLHGPKIRDVIDTIAKKAVLILGRFDETQKPVLEAIRSELRKYDYLPILFDWDKPASQDLLETVSTLAHLSRFVIADITNAKSIPAELVSIVPALPSVAVQPLMLRSDYEYALFDHIRRYPWVLDVYLYDNQDMLLTNLKEHVIDPAEAKTRKLIPPAANR